MWVADLQLPLGDGTIQGLQEITGSKSILLKKNVEVTIGRAKDCDIVIDHPKVSRYQSKITVKDNDNLQFLNVGNGTWIYADNILTKQPTKPLILSSTVSLKLKSAGNWKIKFYKVTDIRVSTYISDQLKDTLELPINVQLNDEDIEIEKSTKKVKNFQSWIDQLRLGKWNDNGGLSKILIPEYEDDIMEDTMIKPRVTDNMVDIEPIDPSSQYSLTNRTSKRNRKSQLHTMFDELEDFDEINTKSPSTSTQYSAVLSQSGSRNRKSQLTQFFDDLDDSEPVLDFKSTQKENIPESSAMDVIPNSSMEADDVDKEMSNLSLKRSNDEVVEIPPKRVKVDTEKKMEKESLADVFKRTKQIKIDRMKKEENFIGSMDERNEQVKVKKFQPHVVVNNPKVYSGYKTMYDNDPKWENRLNYSKFSKVNNNSNYNPILDSTIRTIKFKSSRYKSNERQVNINQNDDMIPELDTMFEPRPRQSQMLVEQSLPTLKRKRESGLFVDSDYEDTQEYNTNDVDTTFKAPDTIPNTFTRSVNTSSRSKNSRNTSTSSNTSYNFDDGEDYDDTPVFRSRRR